MIRYDTSGRRVMRVMSVVVLWRYISILMNVHTYIHTHMHIIAFWVFICGRIFIITTCVMFLSTL
jgi:hypothetical protein